MHVLPEEIAAYALDPHRWRRLSAGDGAKGALVAQLAIHGALIPLTIPEVRRLVYRLVVRILAPPEALLHWSRWRRLHQACAMRSRYRHRRAQQRFRAYRGRRRQ